MLAFMHSRIKADSEVPYDIFADWIFVITIWLYIFQGDFLSLIAP